MLFFKQTGSLTGKLKVEDYLVLVYQPLLCCFPGSGILPKSRSEMDMTRSPWGDELYWMYAREGTQT